MTGTPSMSPRVMNMKRCSRYIRVRSAAVTWPWAAIPYRTPFIPSFTFAPRPFRPFGSAASFESVIATRCSVPDARSVKEPSASRGSRFPLAAVRGRQDLRPSLGQTDPAAPEEPDRHGQSDEEEDGADDNEDRIDAERHEGVGLHVDRRPDVPENPPNRIGIRAWERVALKILHC